MNDYPASIVPVNHVAPVPRRIRAYLGAEKVLDTTRALYVWEWPHYPQYYIPLDDVRRDLLVSEGHTQRTGRGLAELHGLTAGETHQPRAARLITDSAIDGLKGTVRFEWAALDWNEPAIRFYKSLGAVALDDWTIFRVTGPALVNLADMR